MFGYGSKRPKIVQNGKKYQSLDQIMKNLALKKI